MKSLYLSTIVLFLAFSSCKEVKKNDTAATQKEQTIIEKIAYANGYNNWNNVQTIKFTFNVDRDTSHFERSWSWKPKENIITSTKGEEKTTYNRGTMDSITSKIDEGFINDKYWLLAPINILWDEHNLTTEYKAESTSPINGKKLQKLTVVYANEGGYTPGDAYDFYFSDDYIVQEWVFRKKNQAETSLATTWENYENKGGLKIAMHHANADGSFKLYFTNVAVTTK